MALFVDWDRASIDREGVGTLHLADDVYCGRGCDSAICRFRDIYLWAAGIVQRARNGIDYDNNGNKDYDGDLYKAQSCGAGEGHG